MHTPIANAANARRVTFDLYEQGSRKIDAARERTLKEIAKIEAETYSPPEPKHVSGSMLEAEIRNALAAMKPKERANAIHEAIENGDDATVGAIMRGPLLLTGLTASEREIMRHRWRAKRFPKDSNACSA